jgi:hypothetical protein
MKDDEDEFDTFGKTVAVKLRQISEYKRRKFLEIEQDINQLLHNAELDMLPE